MSWYSSPTAAQVRSNASLDGSQHSANGNHNSTPQKSHHGAEMFGNALAMSPYGMTHSIAPVSCENCDELAATIHCITCDGSLCGQCDAKCHTGKLMQKHVRGPLQELRTVKCSTHGEVMKMYCNQCSSLICRDCVDFGEHKGHNVNLLNKVAEKQRSELRSLMSQACVIVAQLTSVAQQVSHTMHYLGIETLHQEALEEAANGIKPIINRCGSGSGTSFDASESRELANSIVGAALRARSRDKHDDDDSSPAYSGRHTPEENSAEEIKAQILLRAQGATSPSALISEAGAVGGAASLPSLPRKKVKGTAAEGRELINSHFDAIILQVQERRNELLDALRSLTKEKATALGAQAYALNTIIQSCNEAIERCRVAIKANDNGVAAAFMTVRNALEQAIAIDMSLHLQPVADSHMCILLPESVSDVIRNHGSVGGPGTPKEVKMQLRNNFVILSWVSGTNRRTSDETYVIQQTIQPDTHDAVPIISEIDRTKANVTKAEIDVSGLNSKRLSFRVKAIDSAGNSSFLSVAVDIIIPDILSHQLQFTEPFDTGGLFYYIGVAGGSRPYQNPHNAGDVVAALSNSGGFLSSHAYKFVGRTADGFNFTSDEAGSWMGVDIGPKRRLIPNYYCLRSDQCPRKMLNWELQAMVGGEKGEWVTIKRHEDDSSLADEPHSVAAWPITLKDDTPYRYFRIYQFGKNTSGTHHLACCGMELYGSFVELQ